MLQTRTSCELLLMAKAIVINIDCFPALKDGAKG